MVMVKSLKEFIYKEKQHRAHPKEVKV